MVDWSARSAPSPVKPTKDAIFIAVATQTGVAVSYHRTRAAAHAFLEQLFDAALATRQRILAGFDFPFGYPAGFAEALTGSADPFAVWSWLTDQIADDDRNANNRLAIADQINAKFPGTGPFWSHPTGATPTHVPFRKPSYEGFPFQERRQIEQVLRGASSCFQLYGVGAVASQSLVGLPRLNTLRLRYGDALAVRPFEDRDAPIILAEIYPSLLSNLITARRAPDEILDAAQVRVVAQAFAALDPQSLDQMLREGDREEGWILGVGHEALLEG